MIIQIFCRTLFPFVLLAFIAALAACSESRNTSSEAPVERPFVTAADAALNVRQLYFAKNHANAAEQSDGLLDRYPDDPELAAWLVLCMARSGEADSARFLFEDLNTRFADNPWSQFAAASAMIWSKAYDREEALATSASALAANPEHPDFVWLHAESMRMKNQKVEAVEFLDSHPLQLKANPELMNVRAASLFDLALADPMDSDKRAAALEAFAETRTAFPDNVNAHYGPGWFLMVQQRPAEAYPLLKRAAELSDARPVVATYWGAILQQEDRTEDEKLFEFEESFNRLLELQAVEPDVLRVASRIYGELGKTDKQQDIADLLRARAPQSRAAEDLINSVLIRMQGDPNRDDTRFREMLRNYLARDSFFQPVFRQQAQRMLFDSIADDPAVDASELRDLLQAMSEEGGKTKIMAHRDGAIALANRGAFVDFAEELARNGLESVPALIHARLASVPPHVKLPDISSELEASMRDALGWVYYKQDRQKPALEELEAAYALDNSSPSLLLHLAKVYESQGDFARAEHYLIQCTALPMAESHPCANVLKEYFVRRGIGGSFDDYLKSKHDQILEARNSRIDDATLQDQKRPPPFELTSLDGQTVRLQDLQGKFVIIKFWATWCAPCRVEMPFYHDLSQRLLEVDDIRVLSVSVDANPDAVRNWLDENDLEIEVLMDDQYATSANIFGIPKTWFLDPDLNKVYELQGMSPDLENEYIDRLNAMRAARGN